MKPYILNEKEFDSKSFIDDVSKRPFSLVYSFDDPHEKLDVLNSLLLQCIDQHAPLKKRKIGKEKEVTSTVDAKSNDTLTSKPM